MDNNNPDHIHHTSELEAWTENHKQNLKELVDNNFPKDKAERLFDYILRDNPFLNEPSLNQDVYSDEEWSYKMKETISSVISQHPIGFEIEVLSLTCKQLTCEMMVRQLVNGSWYEIYSALMGYFISNQYAIQTQDMKQFRFKNGEEYIIYQHFIFAE